MSLSVAPRTPAADARTERLLWLSAAGLIALFLTCLRLTTTEPFELTTFARLIDFDAVEPFQHRVLLPAAAAGIQAVAPLGETLLFGLMEMGFWMALIGVAYRALAQFGIGESTLSRRLLAFTIVIPMLLHLITPDLQITQSFSASDDRLDLGTWEPRAIYYYVYDLPAAVFTLALVLMLSRLAERPHAAGIAAYLAVFAVATFNRETTVFLLPFVALLFWQRLSFTRWAAFLAAQALLFAAIQLPLQWLFADNVNPNAQLGSTQYEFHLVYNLIALSSPLYALTYIARFAAGLYLPLLVWRRHLDRRLALALIGFALPLALFAVVVGRLVEQRIFIEIVPLIWLGALQVISARCADTGAADARR